MTTISILGSTGSIGSQALQIVEMHPERFKVACLTARARKDLLFEQVRKFQPQMAGLTEAIPLTEVPADLRHIQWVMGPEALHVAAAEVPTDQVLVSVVGIAGLQSVMDALEAGRQVLLANKEALVTGGIFADDLERGVGGAVIHADYLDVLQRLRHDRVERLAQVALGVVDGHDDGYLGHVWSSSLAGVPTIACRVRD